MKSLQSILRLLAVVVFFFTPYISIFAARAAYAQRGYFAIGGEFLVPVLCFVVLFILLDLSSKLDKGNKR